MENNNIKYKYKQILLKNFINLGDIEQYNKNTLVEFEYKKLDYIYLIIEGLILQYFLDMEGKERTILILSTGDIFGEITMIQGDHDRVITKTHSNVKLCKISKSNFYNYLEKNPNIYNSLLLMISTKFRTLMYQIHDNAFFHIKDRLLNLLKRLDEQEKAIDKIFPNSQFNFTHEDYANMINSTRSTITRNLKILEEESKIKRSGRKIQII